MYSVNTSINLNTVYTVYTIHCTLCSTLYTTQPLGSHLAGWDTQVRPLPATAPGLYCTLFTVHCILYTVLYTVHRTLYTVQCTVYDKNCTVYCVLCTLYSVHFTYIIDHFTVYVAAHSKKQYLLLPLEIWRLSDWLGAPSYSSKYGCDYIFICDSYHHVRFVFLKIKKWLQKHFSWMWQKNYKTFCQKKF